MNSSTGFKKRNLLRPASSMLHKQRQFLRMFDISLSQPVISTSMRSQIASIQQQINLLDKDKRIRQAQSSLQKSYVAMFKKWLKDHQNALQKEDDDGKILKYMGVDGYQAGFRKLWKVFCNLDLMVSKITELQIVQFLAYDEMFDSISEESMRSNALLNSIAKNGYNTGSFQITRVQLDRMKDLFVSSKKGMTSSTFKTQPSTKDQTSELISELRYENNKLTELLEQMTIQREKEKQSEKRRIEREKENKVVQNKTEKRPIAQTSNNMRDTIKDFQDKYNEQIKYLTLQRNRADESVSELKVKLSNAEVQLKFADKDEDMKRPAVKSGSYEQALMEEMEKMKKGFQRKIKILNDEYQGKERDMRRREIDYKNQNQKIKWQKSLLLKKFDMMASK